MKIICNPLNLPYRYQMRGASHPACREAADPTLLEVNGQYALFPSMRAKISAHGPSMSFRKISRRTTMRRMAAC